MISKSAFFAFPSSTCPTYMTFLPPASLSDVSVNEWPPKIRHETIKQCEVNVRLHPYTTLCQVIFSGGWFQSASEVLSTEKKSQKNIEMFSSGFSPLFCHLIPGRGPEAFGALRERSGFRSHCEGLATTVRTQETDDCRGPIGMCFKAYRLM